jgi:hypothetical protein
MTISSKTFTCTVVLLAVVLGLLVMLSYFKFQTTLTGLIQNRLAGVNITIEESIHSAIDLGLTLRQVRTASALIARAKQNDPGIQSIEIFDPNGHVLYSTQEGPVNRTVSTEILQTQQKATDRRWGLDTGQTFVSGILLVNSFDQPVGAVAITYAKAGFDAQVAALTHSLIRNSILVLVGLAVLAALGIKLGFRDLSRDMDNIRASLEKRKGGRLAAGAILEVADFDEKLSAIENNMAQAMTGLDDVEDVMSKGSI